MKQGIGHRPDKTFPKDEWSRCICGYACLSKNERKFALHFEAARAVGGMAK